MEFKYFEDFERLSFLTEYKVKCEFCEKQILCFELGSGNDEVFVCPQCLSEKKLYGGIISTNQGNFELLLSQIKNTFFDLTNEAQYKLAEERTKEIEQATPTLVTWQDMRWPCIDADYAKFIGYGSKPFLNSLAHDGDGKSLLEKSIHPELKEYYTDYQWEEMLLDEPINDSKESNEWSVLFYIFKSLSSEKVIIWWDSL